MDVYEKTDRLAAETIQRASRQFNTVRRKVALLADFDEINVLIKRMYNRLRDDNKRTFKQIADAEYLAASEGKLQDELEEDFLLLILDDYDPVTGYVYTRETERKQERLFEKVVSIISHEKSSRKTYQPDRPEETMLYPTNSEIRKAFDTAFRLWANMTQEYALRTHDRARERAFIALKGKSVMWHTEEDARVCKKCEPLDGKIFPIEKLPAKPHLYCRCWITLVE